MRAAGGRRGEAFTDDPTETIHGVQPLGCVEQGRRAWQGISGSSRQRFVAIETAVRRVHDGLVGDPDAIDGLLERVLERRPIDDGRAAEAQIAGRLALPSRQPVDPDRSLDGVAEPGGGDRLHEIAKRAQLDGLDRRLDGRPSRHEEHRNVLLALAQRSQQLDAVQVRHQDVAQDDVHFPIRDEGESRAPVRCLDDIVAGGP